MNQFKEYETIEDDFDLAKILGSTHLYHYTSEIILYKERIKNVLSYEKENYWIIINITVCIIYRIELLLPL